MEPYLQEKLGMLRDELKSAFMLTKNENVAQDLNQAIGLIDRAKIELEITEEVKA